MANLSYATYPTTRFSFFHILPSDECLFTPLIERASPNAHDLKVTRIAKFWNMLSPEGIMPARHGRQGRIILLTLIAAITVDKVFVSREFPEVSGWMNVNPMPVFLDIPADLSLTFGVVPVSILFLLLYGAFERHTLWRAFTALLIIPCWMLSGSLLYRLVEDQLSKQVRNAIGSFGITADIHSILPGHEFIHLRGSMVMFIFLFPGLYFYLRRINRAVPAGMIPNPPTPAPANPTSPAKEKPIPVTTPCTEIAPVAISPVRIHIQYPKPFGPDC